MYFVLYKVHARVFICTKTCIWQIYACNFTNFLYTFKYFKEVDIYLSLKSRSNEIAFTKYALKYLKEGEMYLSLKSWSNEIAFTKYGLNILKKARYIYRWKAEAMQ